MYFYAFFWFFFIVFDDFKKEDKKTWTVRSSVGLVKEQFNLHGGKFNNTLLYEMANKYTKKNYKFYNYKGDFEGHMLKNSCMWYSIQHYLHGLHVRDNKYVKSADNLKFTDMPLAQQLLDRTDSYSLNTLLIEAKKLKKKAIFGFRYCKKIIPRNSWGVYNYWGNDISNEKLNIKQKTNAINAWQCMRVLSDHIVSNKLNNKNNRENFNLLQNILTHEKDRGKYRIYLDRCTDIHEIYKLYFYGKAYFHFTLKPGDPIKYESNDGYTKIGIIKSMFFVKDRDGWLSRNLFQNITYPSLDDEKTRADDSRIDWQTINCNYNGFPENALFWFVHL